MLGNAKETLAPWPYRMRSRLIIALVAFLVLCPWWRQPLDAVAVCVGAALILVGVAVRLACIRQIGGSARKQKVAKAPVLVTWGPFSHTRNPIYLANMAMFVGFTVLAGLAVTLPVLLAIMWIQYAFAVRYEEGFLRSRFESEFDAYCVAVPRWTPRLHHATAPADFARYPVRKILRRERSLFFQVAGGLLAVGLRAFV